MNNKIVILGGGVAAINAIKAMREVDSECPIYLFEDEKFYPYNRIKLTKALFGKLEEKDILLQKKEWYEANKVSLRLNASITGLDVQNKEIILEDGSTFNYDKLLIANGASNNIPPIEGIDIKNVFNIRHLEDAWAVRNSSAGKDKILYIGGGIQGLETTWELNQQGKKVMLVELQSRLMPRQLDSKASEILLNLIKNFHIKVLLDTEIVKIYGDELAEGAITKEGSIIPCEMAVYSAGIKPNTSIYTDTELQINNGVVVNNKMETSVEDIYAAGDIAEFDGKVGGLWNIAIEQGKTAGYNIAGKETFYKYIVPVTTLNAFGISLFSMGNVDETQCSTTLTASGADNSLYKRIFIKENNVVGAIVIGDTKKSPVLKAAIEEHISLEDFNLDNMSADELLLKLKK